MSRTLLNEFQVSEIVSPDDGCISYEVAQTRLGVRTVIVKDIDSQSRELADYLAKSLSAKGFTPDPASEVAKLIDNYNTICSGGEQVIALIHCDDYSFYSIDGVPKNLLKKNPSNRLALKNKADESGTEFTEFQAPKGFDAKRYFKGLEYELTGIITLDGRGVCDASLADRIDLANIIGIDGNLYFNKFNFEEFKRTWSLESVVLKADFPGGLTLTARDLIENNMPDIELYKAEIIDSLELENVLKMNR